MAVWFLPPVELLHTGDRCVAEVPCNGSQVPRELLLCVDRRVGLGVRRHGVAMARVCAVVFQRVSCAGRLVTACRGAELPGGGL